MADIELVVKMSEEDYKKVLEINNRECEWNNMHSCYEAILNGTPLPKGHGRLIDADVFREMLENMPTNTDDKWFNWLQKESIRLASTPTIIEADRSVEE